MIRLLITGASGFIGKHCLEALRSSDVEIHATTTRRDVLHLPWAHWHECDLLEPQSTSNIVSKVRPTHLLHLAWIATPGIYWTSPLNEEWRAASVKLAESFISSGGERLVVTGTCAEYDWSKGVCFENDHHPNPTSPYAKAKLALSQQLAELTSHSDVAMAWARLFWMYGPYEYASRFVPSIILSLLRDEPALCTAGTHSRDYLHVSDVARALVTIACSSITGPINVASGVATQVSSIAATIAGAMGKPQLLRLGAIASKTEEPPRVVADIGRLNVAGFIPSLSLDAGLNDTIAWWTQRTEFRNPPADPCQSKTEGACVA